MFTTKGIIPLVFLIILGSTLHAQEVQWSDFLGKPFDSVVTALKAQNELCDTHQLASAKPLVIATCVPYVFLGEKGILVLRRSDKGLVKTCSWIRGDYPGFKTLMDKLDTSRLEQVAVVPGDLDHVFSTVYNYYDRKWRGTIQSTDDGAYYWRPEQLKRKNIEYTMTRTLDYIELSITSRDGKQKALPRNPTLSKN